MIADPEIDVQVEASVQACLTALADGDATAFAAVLSPDAEVLGPRGGGRLGEVDAVSLLSLVGDGAVSGSSIEIQSLRVSHAGLIAWVAGQVVARSGTGCDERTAALQVTGVLERQGAGWVLRQLHLSSPTPADSVAGFDSALDAVTAFVEQERVDLCNCAAPDGTVTLLFTDIENSTPLAEEVGDLRWIELLREHNRIVRDCISLHGGEEVKTIGDAFMVAFGSARRALLCAIAIQQGMSSFEIDGGRAVRVRIGLHPGEPVREGNDFYGKSVVLASRIAGQACGGQILVSSLLRELAESAGDIRFDEGQDASLKGLSGSHRLYSVLWE